MRDERGLAPLVTAVLALPLVMALTVAAAKAFVLYHAASVSRARVSLAAAEAAAAALRPDTGVQGGASLDEAAALRVFRGELARQFNVDPGSLAPRGQTILSGPLVLEQFLVFPRPGQALPALAPNGQPVAAPAVWVRVSVPVRLGSLLGHDLTADIPVQGLAYAPVYQAPGGAWTIGR